MDNVISCDHYYMFFYVLDERAPGTWILDDLRSDCVALIFAIWRQFWSNTLDLKKKLTSMCEKFDLYVRHISMVSIRETFEKSIIFHKCSRLTD